MTLRQNWRVSHQVTLTICCLVIARYKANARYFEAAICSKIVVFIFQLSSLVGSSFSWLLFRFQENTVALVSASSMSCTANLVTDTTIQPAAGWKPQILYASGS